MPTVRESKRKLIEKEELVRTSSSSELQVDKDAAAIWRKVCIVIRSDMDWFGIYILDLTNKSCVDFTVTSPTIRINCEYFFDAAFCVLGSTLYAFQGFDNDWDCPSKERGNKLAFTFDLSSPQVSGASGGLKLEKKMMQEISPMHYPKYGTPIALPTLDGKKILLFSSLIKFHIPLTEKCDFELYNPSTGKWKKLPGIPRPPHQYKFVLGINVHSYTFTNQCVLLIRTDIGLYSLDFGVKNGCWERVYARVPRCGGHFVMIGSELCLTQNHPYVKGDGDGGEWELFDYPNLTYLPRPYFSDVTTSVALNDDNFHFCVLQTGIGRDSTQARLTLDLCTLNLPNCIDKLKRNRNLSDLPGTTVVKSFKFFVENQVPIDRFYPVFFSFIPPPIALSTSGMAVRASMVAKAMSEQSEALLARSQPKAEEPSSGKRARVEDLSGEEVRTVDWVRKAEKIARDMRVSSSRDGEIGLASSVFKPSSGEDTLEKYRYTLRETNDKAKNQVKYKELKQSLNDTKHENVLLRKRVEELQTNNGDPFRREFDPSQLDPFKNGDFEDHVFEDEAGPDEEDEFAKLL